MSGSSLDDLLQVVEQRQGVPRRQVLAENRPDRPPWLIGDPEGGSDRGEHQSRIAHGVEGNEP